MLSIAAMGAGSANYYAALATEDYYLVGGEPPGRWWGPAAEALDLEGQVDTPAFKHLFHGLTPDGKSSLVQQQRRMDGTKRQPGWDLTFSAPKSVSVLWSQSDGDKREMIQRCVRNAVHDALDFVQYEAGLTRRAKGGKKIESAKLMAALFEHGTNREQEPQLHIHALILNVGQREDRTWGTVVSRGFFQQKMAAGAVFRASLAQRLIQTLGVRLRHVQRDGWDHFEVKGVSTTLCESFSSRRTQIVEYMARHGQHGAKAAERAALNTRPRKLGLGQSDAQLASSQRAQNEGHTRVTTSARHDLFRGWQAEGRAMGFGPQQSAGLINRSQEPRQVSEQRLDRLISGYAQRLAESQAGFSRSHLIKSVLDRLAFRGDDPSRIIRGIDRWLAASGQAYELASSLTDRRFTTQTILDAESELLKLAHGGMLDTRHLVSGRAFAHATTHDPSLNTEQLNALKHITQRKGDIQCVSGMAGTGKTRMLRAARLAWEKQGLRVVGCAVAARAARGLEDGSGIKSYSLTKLGMLIKPSPRKLIEHAARQFRAAARAWKTHAMERLKLNPKTVVVLDEAGMVGTRDLLAITQHIKQAGAKLVLVGDAGQLQAIEAGGAFLALAESLGSAKLEQIMRQRHAWMQQAVHHFAGGDAPAALALYAHHDRLSLGSGKPHVMSELISCWARHRHRNLKENLILTSTREDAALLNLFAQQHRLERREVKPRQRIRIGKQTFHVGDRVLLGQNHRGLKILNGDFGVIEQVHNPRSPFTRAVTVRLDRTQQAPGWLPREARPIRATFRTKDYDQITLGYAATTHAAQGVTVENSFVYLGSTMLDRHSAYVQASRAREATYLFADKHVVGRDIAALADTMSLDHTKRLAQEQTSPKNQHHPLGIGD